MSVICQMKMSVARVNKVKGARVRVTATGLGGARGIFRWFREAGKEVVVVKDTGFAGME